MRIEAETAVDTQWPGDKLRKAGEVDRKQKNLGEEVTRIPEIRNDGKRYEGTKQT